MKIFTLSTKLSVILLFTIVSVSTLFAGRGTSPIRVNQMGYFEKAKKVAVIVNSSTSPLTWSLYKNGQQKATGITTPIFDDAADERVHEADFSTYDVEGSGYTIKCGTNESDPFNITNVKPWGDLLKESMKYFYIHRKNIGVTEQYAGAGYDHNAIHPALSSVQLHDYGYKVVNASKNWVRQVTNRGDWCANCDNLDARGGHMDAGDYNIYTVNATFAMWYLFNVAERYSTGDNIFSIPEANNSIPDFVDEALYGSSWIDNMLPKSGGANNNYYAYHSVHKDGWGSSYGVDAENTNNQGSIKATHWTSAATYAVARNQAQQARLQASNGLSSAATSSWAAAEDAWRRLQVNSFNRADMEKWALDGGGTYGEEENINADKDNYFAALAELYLTAYARGDADASTYKSLLMADPLYKSSFTPMGWNSVYGNAMVSLITVPNDLPTEDISVMQDSILVKANRLINHLAASNIGYPSLIDPYSPGNRPRNYVWGSNSDVINGAIIAAIAYDISVARSAANTNYIHVVTQAMDYILGTNAVNISFVTGFGEHAEYNTHDRLGSNEYGNSFPAGILAGGPNNQLIGSEACDPVTPCLPNEYSPAKSYADDGTGGDAWCSKENAINWNAPLAWLAWWADNKVAAALGEGTSAPAENIISNGDFASSTNWGTTLTNGSVSFSSQIADWSITTTTANIWEPQLKQNISLTGGQAYTLCFDIKTDESARTINVNINDAGTPSWARLGLDASVDVTTAWTTKSYQFTASGSDASAQLEFNLGLDTKDVQIDNVKLWTGNVDCGQTPVTNYTLSTSATNGTVSLNPAGGTYASGTVVTVTAAPNSGYTFSSWSGDVTGSTNPVTITMSSNKSVTASFSVSGGESQFSVVGATASYSEGTYNASNVYDNNTSTRWGSSGATSIPNIYVDLGSTKTITRVVLIWEAAYASGYRLQTSNSTSGPWTTILTVTGENGGTDDKVLSGSGRYVRMEGFTEATAWRLSLYEFKVYGTSGTMYTLSSSGANGTVSLNPAGGSYASGSVVTLTATPNSGYSFSGWSGDATGSTNPVTVTMNANKTVTATFSALPTYTVTTSATNGTVTLNPAGGSYASGTVVTLTAAANSGYSFTGWSGDLTGSTNPSTITVNSNKSVTAIFAAVPTYTLTASGTNGTVTLNPAGGSYASGTVVTLTAAANSGYSFTGWSGALTGSTNPSTITVNSNKSVTATFAAAQTCPTCLGGNVDPVGRIVIINGNSYRVKLLWGTCNTSETWAYEPAPCQ